MITTQQHKAFLVIPPEGLVDNAAFTEIEIDTKGFSYCTVYACLGATDIAMAGLKMQESDTSGSGQADITGLVFGTSTNTEGDTSALPTALEDDLIFGFDIDLRGRKRYLTCVATAGDGATGTHLTVLALLARAEDGPATAALRGCSQMLRI